MSSLYLACWHIITEHAYLCMQKIYNIVNAS